ncbi:hypothetical protein [Granulosicoccus antarcticus]|uniref:Uncharacterized protein n=1 Tax=Granulosicoccus antarcticus IMCC3135 TaxID=1192854 RepID=A0A2Z2NVF1_9GAMM|nr:hypothetical protein [Granulosicoccus antarcticus]ASJ71114.1 hypothetical protein IMCC3135_05005 [Granulosicoccus antarcticus IMCC3135]
MDRERTQTGCLHQDSLAGAIPSSSPRSSRLRVAVSVALLCMGAGLAACSSSSSGPEPEPEPIPAPPTDSGGEQTDPDEPTGSGGQTGVLEGLLQLEDDPGLLSQIPEVVSIDIRADTGLQIAYTREDQALDVPGALVELQWVFMQSCLEQQSVAPVVVIRDGAVTPFTATDDVIYNIEGIAVASSSRRDVPVIQVQEADFDGSLGALGFNLRSVMGRMLWLSASLPERDYPFDCARQTPE